MQNSPKIQKCTFLRIYNSINRKDLFQAMANFIFQNTIFIACSSTLNARNEFKICRWYTKLISTTTLENENLRNSADDLRRHKQNDKRQKVVYHEKSTCTFKKRKCLRFNIFSKLSRDVLDESFPEFYDYYVSVAKEKSVLDGQSMVVWHNI